MTLPVHAVAKLQKIEQYLNKNGMSYHRTGSRVIGGYTDESDIDLCVFAGGKCGLSFIELEEQCGVVFFYGGSVEGEKDTESYRSDDDWINLVLVFDKKKYYRWATATRVATGLQLHEKPHRVAMFEYLKCGGESKKEEFPSATVPF